ncbi:unnamed protein product [Pedinophyceae sp. YPF-701]|nr:unnamed protein product [Pedinophyceae sp. YPF-701]
MSQPSVRDYVMNENDLRTCEVARCLLSRGGLSDGAEEALHRIINLVEGDGFFHLNLGNLELGDDNLWPIMECLKQSPQMARKVMLEGNNISSKGALQIAEMLRHNRNIIVLVLQCNIIGDEGAVAIADACRKNHVIEVLGLHTNFLTDVGACALGKMLGVNRSLRVLSIWNNAITDVGARDIAEGLKTNYHLEGIAAGFNCITEDGAKFLAEALEKNKKLRHMWLNSNPISENGAQALSDALKDNTTIQQVRLTANGFETYSGMVRPTMGGGFPLIGTAAPHRRSCDYIRGKAYDPETKPAAPEAGEEGHAKPRVRHSLPARPASAAASVRASMEKKSDFFKMFSGKKKREGRRTRESAETVRMSDNGIVPPAPPAARSSIGARPGLTTLKEESSEHAAKHAPAPAAPAADPSTLKVEDIVISEDADADESDPELRKIKDECELLRDDTQNALSVGGRGDHWGPTVKRSSSNRMTMEVQRVTGPVGAMAAQPSAKYADAANGKATSIDDPFARSTKFRMSLDCRDTIGTRSMELIRSFEFPDARVKVDLGGQPPKAVN